MKPLPSLFRVLMVWIPVLAFVLGGLTAWAHTNFGNLYLPGNSGSDILNSPAKWRSLRFTATEDMTIDRFAVTFTSSTGNPQFVVSVYADNAGNPGTLLTSTTLLPGALGTENVYGNFASNINLTKDTVYHVVTRVANGSDTDKVALRFQTSDFSHSPTTGAPDPNFNYLSSANSGSSWTPQASQTSGTMITLALGNANGDAIGQPVGGAFNTFGVGGTATRGQRFVWEGATGDAITSITLRVWRGAGDAADNLNVFLLDQNLSVLGSNLFLNSGFANRTASNYTLTLSTPITLTNGLNYNLVLQSAGSGGNSYLLTAPFVNLTNMYGASFQGTNGFAIVGTGLGSFTNATQSANHIYDMWFNLGIQAIPEPAAVALILFGLGIIGLRRRARD